ncbi:MAG: carbamoyltransferase HypF [Bacteroidales bacterium]|nr:carbamoyltransferase HypF [Bacteroidales bacterium]
MKKAEDKYTVRVYVKGLVQGVGFRPFIYRLAKKNNLKGRVENRNDGVVIEVQGNINFVEKFISSIKTQAPVASNIVRIFSKEIKPGNFSDFRIIKSKNTSDEITDISPDIAVCDDCLKDMKTQNNRINYPFINCTNCGPRFTIIKDLPYDREKTTMSPFIMCESCAAEYKDILDRRFHAQPVACSVCGPEYELIYKGKVINDLQKILKIVCELIEAGKIIAIKGLGGFHIACDAQNEEAVKRLREAKNRDGKPFAVMFSDIESLKNYAIVDEQEEKSLLSWKRPIVLLEIPNPKSQTPNPKSQILNPKSQIAIGVSVGLNTIGAMLPYMPFHFLLFEKLKTPAIVLTSGNISDEPIVINNDEAKKQLSKISDTLLIYNREIYNRTDDSVAMVVNSKERIIRRSRGFAPSPIRLNLNVDGILATGAELKNCFCVGKGNQAILSQHIGDLKNIETYDFYIKTIEQFKKLFRVNPTLIVSDMHPDYLSTKYANDLKSQIAPSPKLWSVGDFSVYLPKISFSFSMAFSSLAAREALTNIISESFTNFCRLLQAAAALSKHSVCRP